MKKEQYHLIKNTLAEKHDYLLKNATPIELETGLATTALQPYKDIIEEIDLLLNAETNKKKETPAPTKN